MAAKKPKLLERGQANGNLQTVTFCSNAPAGPIKGILLIHSPLVCLWEFVRVRLRVFSPIVAGMAHNMSLDMTLYVLYNMTYKQT